MYCCHKLLSRILYYCFVLDELGEKQVQPTYTVVHTYTNCQHPQANYLIPGESEFDGSFVRAKCRLVAGLRENVLHRRERTGPPCATRGALRIAVIVAVEAAIANASTFAWRIRVGGGGATRRTRTTRGGARTRAVLAGHAACCSSVSEALRSSAYSTSSTRSAHSRW